MSISKSWYTNTDPDKIRNSMWDTFTRGFREMPFTVLLAPVFQAQRPHHCNFLKTLWHLGIISLSTAEKCSDAYQEESAKK